MIGRGTVTNSEDGGPVRKLQVRIHDDELHDNVTQVQEYGFASRPLAGCDALLSFIGGDRTAGIVHGTNDQRYRPKNLQPGDVVVYDWRGNWIKLSAAGVTINTPETFRVQAKHIQMHATTSYRFDANGHGQHWYGTYVDTWQIGEVAGTAHAISPPEIS